MTADPRQELLASAGDPGGDIAEAALWLAAEDCDDVDVGASLALVDALGRELDERLRGRRGPDALGVLHGLLRDRLRLRRCGGGDPRAHYLHSVLERGCGIPISCAIVYMAVGRRAGLDVEGVGLPGHFGVRVDGVLADPADGDVLDAAAALRLVVSATGRRHVELDPTWLQPATSRLILARVSRNLRGCYSSLERWDLAVQAADRCVALFPANLSERRDRGLLLFRAGQASAALADLRAYLEGSDAEAPDRAAVEEVAGRIRASLN
ncbi:MAG: transglutaminase family protein [Candidatus Dormibacteria bacterium]